jgi:hypothetical protein
VTPTPEEFDELAKRFEEYEPRPEDRRDPAAYIGLREAASQSEHLAATAAAAARAAGYSWRIVGSLLGLAPEVARQRFGDEGATSRSDT